MPRKQQLLAAVTATSTVFKTCYKTCNMFCNTPFLQGLCQLGLQAAPGGPRQTAGLPAPAATTSAAAAQRRCAARTAAASPAAAAAAWPGAGHAAGAVRGR
jgi:hypothetical protein